ncbi:MAG: DMT family transporter [Actinomycetota bacterium]|nr:DMT family transporter [Actinomycetota bacterium]
MAALVSLGAGIAFGVVGATIGRLSVGVDRLGWVWLVALVLVATVLPLASFLGGIARIGPSAASTISTLEPLTALALSILILGERLVAGQVIGVVPIVGAVVTLTLSSWRLGPRTLTTRCPSP